MRETQLSRLNGSKEVSAMAKQAYATDYVPTLLDLIPEFMTLSAEVATNDPSLKFMLLATEFMLQSAIEQQLSQADEVYTGSATEAFAWGCWYGENDEMDIDAEGEASEGLIKVDVMFRNPEKDEEHEDWTELRQEFAEKVCSLSLKHRASSHHQRSATSG